MKPTKKTILFAIVSVLSLTTGCGDDQIPSYDGIHVWSDADDWAYQLQDIDLVTLGQSPYDILVIDYSSDGTEAGEWTANEIAALKDSSGGPKLVLAYMSIGEAEDYRFYWQPDWGPGHPVFIIREDPDWEGNYLVQYWNPIWQNLMFGDPEAYLDRIISQGFDGVYLDKIDSYEDFPERPSAKQEMMDFVISISNYGKAIKPGFAIFPQNAEELAANTYYLAACTGIGREEVYYVATNTPTSEEERFAIEGILDEWRNAGKVVLTVDYCNTPGAIHDAYCRATAHGYIEYCTTVDLNLLKYNPGHYPD